MKIAVITAIFGGMDQPKPFPEQSTPCDYYCFTEENSPVPLPNLPPRLKAKYFKLQAHRVLPGYDYYVWIDGNIEVTSRFFVSEMMNTLESNDIAIQRHHERQTIDQEIEFILASNNPYLTNRYGDQPLKAKYEHYLKEGMSKDTPLYACNIFGWEKTKATKKFFNEWWRTVLEWSWFDQSAYSFLIGKHYGAVAMFAGQLDLGPMFNNPYFILHPHAKPLQ